MGNFLRSVGRNNWQIFEHISKAVKGSAITDLINLCVTLVF